MIEDFINNAKILKDKIPSKADYKKKNITLYLKIYLYLISNYILNFLIPKSSDLLKLLILKDLAIDEEYLNNIKKFENDEINILEKIKKIEQIFNGNAFLYFNPAISKLKNELKNKTSRNLFLNLIIFLKF